MSEQITPPNRNIDELPHADAIESEIENIEQLKKEKTLEIPGIQSPDIDIDSNKLNVTLTVIESFLSAQSTDISAEWQNTTSPLHLVYKRRPESIANAQRTLKKAQKKLTNLQANPNGTNIYALRHTRDPFRFIDGLKDQRIIIDDDYNKIKTFITKIDNLDVVTDLDDERKNALKEKIKNGNISEVFDILIDNIESDDFEKLLTCALLASINYIPNAGNKGNLLQNIRRKLIAGESLDILEILTTHSNLIGSSPLLSTLVQTSRALLVLRDTVNLPNREENERFTPELKAGLKEGISSIVQEEDDEGLANRIEVLIDTYTLMLDINGPVTNEMLENYPPSELAEKLIEGEQKKAIEDLTTALEEESGPIRDPDIITLAEALPSLNTTSETDTKKGVKKLWERLKGVVEKIGYPKAVLMFLTAVPLIATNIPTLLVISGLAKIAIAGWSTYSTVKKVKEFSQHIKEIENNTQGLDDETKNKLKMKALTAGLLGFILGGVSTLIPGVSTGMMAAKFLINIGGVTAIGVMAKKDLEDIFSQERQTLIQGLQESATEYASNLREFFKSETLTDQQKLELASTLGFDKNTIIQLLKNGEFDQALDQQIQNILEKPQENLARLDLLGALRIQFTIENNAELLDIEIDTSQLDENTKNILEKLGISGEKVGLKNIINALHSKREQINIKELADLMYSLRSIDELSTKFTEVEILKKWGTLRGKQKDIDTAVELALNAIIAGFSTGMACAGLGRTAFSAKHSLEEVHNNLNTIFNLHGHEVYAIPQGIPQQQAGSIIQHNAEIGTYGNIHGVSSVHSIGDGFYSVTDNTGHHLVIAPDGIHHLEDPSGRLSLFITNHDPDLDFTTDNTGHIIVLDHSNHMPLGTLSITNNGLIQIDPSNVDISTLSKDDIEKIITINVQSAQGINTPINISDIHELTTQDGHTIYAAVVNGQQISLDNHFRVIQSNTTIAEPFIGHTDLSHIDLDNMSINDFNEHVQTYAQDHLNPQIEHPFTVDTGNGPHEVHQWILNSPAGYLSAVFDKALADNPDWADQLHIQGNTSFFAGRVGYILSQVMHDNPNISANEALTITAQKLGVNPDTFKELYLHSIGRLGETQTITQHMTAQIIPESLGYNPIECNPISMNIHPDLAPENLIPPDNGGLQVLKNPIEAIAGGMLISSIVGAGLALLEGENFSKIFSKESEMSEDLQSNYVIDVLTKVGITDPTNIEVIKSGDVLKKKRRFLIKKKDVEGILYEIQEGDQKRLIYIEIDPNPPIKGAINIIIGFDKDGKARTQTMQIPKDGNPHFLALKNHFILIKPDGKIEPYDLKNAEQRRSVINILAGLPLMQSAGQTLQNYLSGTNNIQPTITTGSTSDDPNGKTTTAKFTTDKGTITLTIREEDGDNRTYPVALRITDENGNNIIVYETQQEEPIVSELITKLIGNENQAEKLLKKITGRPGEPSDDDGTPTDDAETTTS